MNQSMLKFRDLPLKAQTAIAVFASSGAITLILALMSQLPSFSVRLLLLMSLAMGTAHKKFRLYKDSSISFLTSVILLSILVAGTTEAILTAVCGVAIQTYFPSRRLIPHRLLFNTGMIAVVVKASCWVYSFCVTDSSGQFANQLMAIVAASSVYYLGNSISVSLMIALSTHAHPLRMWREHFAFSGPSFLIAGLLSMLASEVTMRLPETVILLLIIPVVISAYYFSLRLVAART